LIFAVFGGQVREMLGIEKANCGFMTWRAIGNGDLVWILGLDNEGNRDLEAETMAKSC
jgi:hypothetical protein